MKSFEIVLDGTISSTSSKHMAVSKPATKISEDFGVGLIVTKTGVRTDATVHPFAVAAA